MSISATQECIESLLQRGLGHPSVVALGFQQALSPPTSAEIATALAFESPMATRETVFAKARELSAKFPAVSEFSKVATLLQFSLGFYLPLALFDVPVMPGQMSFVRHGVDIYRRLVAPAPEGSFLPVGARLAQPGRSRAAPRTKVVFPVPSSPETVTTSPIASSPASVAAISSVVDGRSDS